MSNLSNSVPIPQQELKALASTIRAADQSVALAANNLIEHALAAGDALIEAKEKVGHGNWLPYLRDQCGLSEDRAEKYMRLARGREVLANSADARNLAELSLAAALRLIDGAKRKAHASAETGSSPKSDADGAGDRRPRYRERAAIHYRFKFGAAAMAKIRGTSLDKVKELDELLILNRGAPEGELTPIVRRLVDDAAAGKDVSAFTPRNSAKPSTVPANFTDAEWTAALRDLGLERFVRIMPAEWRPALAAHPSVKDLKISKLKLVGGTEAPPSPH